MEYHQAHKYPGGEQSTFASSDGISIADFATKFCETNIGAVSLLAGHDVGVLCLQRESSNGSVRDAYRGIAHRPALAQVMIRSSGPVPVVLLFWCWTQIGRFFYLPLNLGDPGERAILEALAIPDTIDMWVVFKPYDCQLVARAPNRFRSGARDALDRTANGTPWTDKMHYEALQDFFAKNGGPRGLMLRLLAENI